MVHGNVEDDMVPTGIDVVEDTVTVTVEEVNVGDPSPPFEAAAPEDNEDRAVEPERAF